MSQFCEDVTFSFNKDVVKDLILDLAQKCLDYLVEIATQNRLGLFTVLV